MPAGALRTGPICTHCKAILSEPEWSEIAGQTETVYSWRCASCGHEFETREPLVDPQLSKDELAEEFLPNLVVE